MGRIRESSLTSGWNGVSDFQTDPYLVRFMYFTHEVSFWFWPSYQCNRIEVKRDSHNTLYLKCLFFCILSVFSCLENWETTWNHHMWLVDQVSSWTALGQVVLTSLHSAQREVHGAIRDEPDAWHVPTWLPGYRLIHWLYPIGSMYGIYANIWGILMVNVIIYSIHGSYGYWIKLRISKQAYVVLTGERWARVSKQQFDRLQLAAAAQCSANHAEENLVSAEQDRAHQIISNPSSHEKTESPLTLIPVILEEHSIILILSSSFSKRHEETCRISSWIHLRQEMEPVPRGHRWPKGCCSDGGDLTQRDVTGRMVNVQVPK